MNRNDLRERLPLEELTAFLENHPSLPMSEEQVRVALSEERCTWKYYEEYDAGYWETLCGDAFQFADGTPQENNFRFCPYCGLRIEQLDEGVGPDGQDQTHVLGETGDDLLCQICDQKVSSVTTYTIEIGGEEMTVWACNGCLTSVGRIDEP